MRWQNHSALSGFMNKVVIYTTPICRYCVQAKRLLSRKGVAL